MYSSCKMSTPYRLVAPSLVVTALLLAGCNRGGPVALTAESPKHNYIVEVSGQFSRPTAFFVNHVITFTARRNGTAIANGRLYEGDNMDGGFGDTYPRHDWPDEHVLRFLAASREYAPVTDRVTLVNRSSTRLAFATVSYTDLVLILDVDPGASVGFSTARRDPTYTYVSIVAQLDGSAGRLFAGRSVASSEGRQPVKPMNIEITVGQVEIGLSLRSSDTK